MRRLRVLPSGRFAQLLLESLAAVTCGVVLGWWLAHGLAGTPFPIAPRVAVEDDGAGNDPLDRIMRTAPLFGSRRPGGPAGNIVALGLISDASGRGGAIVAVDGQAPRAVQVGDRIEGRLVTAIDAKGLTLEGSNGPDSVPLVQKATPSLTGMLLNAPTSSPTMRSQMAAPAPGLLGTPLDGGMPAVQSAASAEASAQSNSAIAH